MPAGAPSNAGSSSPAAKRRPLRSNTEEARIAVTPAPQDLRLQFFTKDFGTFGVFVGTCIGVRRGAHKFTGEDMYCVQYDDGDAEEMSLQALQRLIQHNNLSAMAKLSPKLARALRTLKGHLAIPLPENYFDVPVARPRARSPAGSESDSGLSVESSRSRKTPTPKRSHKKDDKAAAGTTPKRMPREASASPPPTPLIRSSYVAPAAQARPVAKAVTALITAANGAWDGERNVLVERVLGRRDVTVAEYQVRLGGAGKTPGLTMWLPASQLHTQLVAEFERTNHNGHSDSSSSSSSSSEEAEGERGKLRDVLAKLRQVLAFMEPPAWALTSQTIAALSDAQLADFPLQPFLDSYLYHTLECMDQVQRGAREVRAKQAVDGLRVEADPQ